jgi:hypothetical protein
LVGREGSEGADDLEIRGDEDVVRPVDADVVNLELTVTQLHNPVDDASRVGRQRGFRRLVGSCSLPSTGITATCVAVMVVPLVVPSTRTLSPGVISLADVEFVPSWYVVEDASSTVTF